MKRTVCFVVLAVVGLIAALPATAQPQSFKADLHDNLACPPAFDFCGKGLVHGFGTATTTLNFTGAVPVRVTALRRRRTAPSHSTVMAARCW